jgi:hypothetical protein
MLITSLLDILGIILGIHLLLKLSILTNNDHIASVDVWGRGTNRMNWLGCEEHGLTESLNEFTDNDAAHPVCLRTMGSRM